MKSIIFIIPYFGKLPNNFQLWLLSCKTNSSINWLIITDDKTNYNYPQNVSVVYDTFENIKNKIQKHYDFEIFLDRPWKLCDFKPAYGEIFFEYIKDYDFWGHCDIDLMWGNLRNFYTEDILNKYDKIGFQGHATIYRNKKEVNLRYRFEDIGSNLLSYREAFSHERGYCFDEGGMSRIYEYLKIPYYNKTNFAHLSKYDYGFFLELLPKEENYKNKNQIITWENGKIYRYYIYNNKINRDEFMYVHFFCRPMTYKVNDYNTNNSYVFYPDVAEKLKNKITVEYIKSKSKRSKFRYYFKSFWYNRKKITIKRIIYNIKYMILYKKSNK